MRRQNATAPCSRRILLRKKLIFLVLYLKRPDAVGFATPWESAVGFATPWESSVGFATPWESSVGVTTPWESAVGFTTLWLIIWFYIFQSFWVGLDTLSISREYETLISAPLKIIKSNKAFMLPHWHNLSPWLHVLSPFTLGGMSKIKLIWVRIIFHITFNTS